MHRSRIRGFLPNVRVGVLLASCGFAACGSEEKKPPTNPSVNHAPVAVSDVATTDEDTAMSISAATLVANDTDADGDALGVSAVGAATHGTVTLSGGNVVFTPEANFFGNATFEYTVSDGARTSTATVTVTVRPVNDAPVAVADSADGDEDVVLRIPVASLLANDTDVEGDSLTVTLIANANNGTATLEGDAVSFRPNPGFKGAAGFEYQVSDVHGATATGSVDLRIHEHALKEVIAGSLSTCAIYVDGRLRCWGGNAYGELGLGDTVNRGVERYQLGSFLPFTHLGSEQKLVTLADSCALFESGAVKCWGANFYGELGLGDREHRGDAPGEMGDALPFVGLGTGRSAKAIDRKPEHTCAILDDGSVKCWGENSYGQLGIGEFDHRGEAPGDMGDALPAVNLGAGRTAKAISTGSWHTCAILDDDSVKCWGWNRYGQLGIGDTTDRGHAPGDMGDALPAVNLGAGRTAKAIATGSSYTCAVLDDGSVKCWGEAYMGRLGLGDWRNRGTSPEQMGDGLPAVNLGTGRTAKSLVLGAASACAILDDGSVKCWGSNTYGQLGLGDSQHRGDDPGEMGDALPPVDLGTGRTVRALTSGLYHVCARFADDTVKCWGANDDGQLGLGDSMHRGDNPGEMGDALPVVEL